MSESPSSARRRPRDSNVDDGGGFHATPRVERVVYSPVAQLLNDIAYQWQKEQRRAAVRSSSRTRRRRDDGHRTAMTTTAAGESVRTRDNARFVQIAQNEHARHVMAQVQSQRKLQTIMFRKY